MSTIMYGTGNTHFDEWVDSLATTTLPQGTSRLVTINYESGNPEGYCCMGQACTLVPGLSLSVNEEDTSDYEDPLPEGETRYDEAGAFAGWSEMAPPELLDWLGVEHNNNQRDIFVDLPEAYWPTQGARLYKHDAEGVTEEFGSNHDAPEPRLGCSVLNDRLGLTFAQISDVLRYFGIKDAVLLD